MKTLRGKSEPDETAAQFARALESATALWDQGDPQAATMVLRQAADAAARAGDVTRADKLEQLFQMLESAVRRGGSELVPTEESEPDSQPETMPSGVPRQAPEANTGVRVRRAPYSMKSRGERNRRSTMPAAPDVEKQPASDPLRFTPSATSSGPVPYPHPGWYDRDGSDPDFELEEFAPRPRLRSRRAARHAPRHKKRPVRRRAPSRPWAANVAPLESADEAPGAQISSERDPAVRVAVRSAFSKLPQNARILLRRTAVRLQLEQGATMPDFGMAFLSRGALCAHPGRLDLCAVEVRAGTLVRGGAGSSPIVDKRWIACGGSASLTLWDEVATTKLLSLAQGLEEMLRSATHRIDALVCATQGPLGEKFCRRIRESLLARANVTVLMPHEVLVAKGNSLPGLIVMGAGCLLQTDGPWTVALPPGGVPCLTAVLSRSPAPVTLRAGEAGASVLVTDLRSAHELFCTMPALLDLLSRD